MKILEIMFSIKGSVLELYSCHHSPRLPSLYCPEPFGGKWNQAKISVKGRFSGVGVPGSGRNKQQHHALPGSSVAQPGTVPRPGWLFRGAARPGHSRVFKVTLVNAPKRLVAPQPLAVTTKNAECPLTEKLALEERDPWLMFMEKGSTSLSIRGDW